MTEVVLFIYLLGVIVSMIVWGAKIIFIVSVALQIFLKDILSNAKSLPAVEIFKLNILIVAVVLLPLFQIRDNLFQLQKSLLIII